MGHIKEQSFKKCNKKRERWLIWKTTVSIAQIITVTAQVLTVIAMKDDMEADQQGAEIGFC